jgi:hypothetical protein
VELTRAIMSVAHASWLRAAPVTSLRDERY